MTNFDEKFWWQFLMTIFDDNFWWQFSMTIFDDNFWNFLTNEKFFDNFEKTVLETCDIWDTDYSSVYLETVFMTIFVTWRLIVTLDSIRNSYDVFVVKSKEMLGGEFW